MQAEHTIDNFMQLGWRILHSSKDEATFAQWKTQRSTILWRFWDRTTSTALGYEALSKKPGHAGCLRE